MNWKNVPLPEYMRLLPRSPQGFPVPYIILQDDDGVYHFKVNDSRKRAECIKDRLCAICAYALGSDMWLVGGPLSAFHSLGVFKDSMMHYECATYALQVCPYLALRNYRPGDVERDLAKINKEEVLAYVDPTVIIDRPQVFACVKIADFEWRIIDNLRDYIVPKRPYLEIELWDEGERVSRDEVEFRGDEINIGWTRTKDELKNTETGDLILGRRDNVN